MFVTISLLLAAACLLPAAAKLTGQPRMRKSAAHFGIPWPRYRLIGVTELAAAAGILTGLCWHPLGLAAAAGMALLLLGAIVTHRRAADGAKEVASALAALALTIAYLAPARLPGASTPCPAIPRSRSRTRLWRWLPRPGTASGGKRGAAARCGSALPMIPIST